MQADEAKESEAYALGKHAESAAAAAIAKQAEDAATSAADERIWAVLCLIHTLLCLRDFFNIINHRTPSVGWAQSYWGTTYATKHCNFAL